MPRRIDRLLSHDQPVCAALALPLALVAIRRDTDPAAGIGVGKSDLVVALHGDETVETRTNDAEGTERLCALLLLPARLTRQTGRALAEALDADGQMRRRAGL